MPALVEALQQAAKTKELPIGFQVTDANPNTKRLAGGLGIANLCKGLFTTVANGAAAAAISNSDIELLI